MHHHRCFFVAMMGAILAYFSSKMRLLLMGADLNAQFKIVYADGTKMGDNTDANASDLRSASENDVNNDIKVKSGTTLNFIHCNANTNFTFFPISPINQIPDEEKLTFNEKEIPEDVTVGQPSICTFQPH